MDRLLAGEKSALEELYDRHTPMLYAVALRILRRTSDAEDVVQEAWVQAWRSAARYDAARGSVAGWLLTITRSRAIDRLRSRASSVNVEAAVEREATNSPPRDEPAAHAVSRQLSERVNEALRTLPENERRTLELAYFSGLSQSEIASRLSAPLGTVKSWSRQGLLRLRELVPQEEWR